MLELNSSTQIHLSLNIEVQTMHSFGNENSQQLITAGVNKSTNDGNKNTKTHEHSQLCESLFTVKPLVIYYLVMDQLMYPKTNHFISGFFFRVRARNDYYSIS